MNINRYMKALNGMIYLEFMLVFLAVLNRIYRHFTMQRLAFLDILIEACLAAFVAGVFLMTGVWLIIHIQHEMQTHGFAEDPAFERIEGVLHSWREGFDSLSRSMLEINAFYEEGGKADEMLQNGQYERLLRRKEFLDRRRSLYNEANACCNVVMVGILSVVVCQLLTQTPAKNETATVMGILGMIMGIGFLGLWKLVQARQGGSFFYMMRNLENGKLVGRMNHYAIKPNYKMGKIDSIIFNSRHLLLDDLIARNVNCLSGKVRRKSHNQIKKVAELNLWAKDYRNVMMREVVLQNGKIYLLYDMDEGEKGDFQTKQGLISEDYKKLHDILKENGMLHFGMTRAAVRIERPEFVEHKFGDNVVLHDFTGRYTENKDEITTTQE